MRRRRDRLRTSTAEKSAKQTSARTETMTKIISHGDVMTSSIQVVSKVPCGEKSSARCRVLRRRGRQARDLTERDGVRQGREQGSVRDLELARKLLPDHLEDGSELC